jgi:hypothetical protein
VIVSEHKQFESYQRSLFNRNTLSQDIEYVLRDIEGRDIHIDTLRDNFDKYKQIYQRLVNEFLASEINFNQFMLSFRTKLDAMCLNDSGKINWDSHVENNLSTIIAYIFALWTLLSADKYLDLSSKECLFQPHPAQVVAIFRMLGLGYKKGFKKAAINKVLQLCRIR